jgi:hypothetical protein
VSRLGAGLLISGVVLQVIAVALAAFWWILP